MEMSDEKIRDVLELKDRITQKIEEHQEEIELLQKNLGILDSLIKQSSFTKASSLVSKKSDIESIPITRGSGGEVIANAYVTPDQVAIVLKENVGMNVDTPPFKSFFLDRIIGEMKRKDSIDADGGKIQKESIIDYIINKNGSNIREIIIRNYRQKERVKEIINTVGWSFTRMLENINQ